MQKILKNIKLIIAIIFYISAAILIVIGGFSVVKINHYDSDIIVSQEITVSSSVTNIINQTYKTTITGKIQNNSDEPLTHIVLYVDCSSSFLGDKETIKINIGTIQPKAYYDINYLTETGANLEKIDELKYTCGASIQPIVFGNEHEIIFNALSILAFFGAAILIAFGVKLTKDWKPICAGLSKNDMDEIGFDFDKEISEPNFEKKLAKALENKQKIEQEKIDIKKEEIRLKKEEIKITKEKQQTQNKLKENNNESTRTHIYCKYCGSKNSINSLNCRNCNSNLD